MCLGSSTSWSNHHYQCLYWNSNPVTSCDLLKASSATYRVADPGVGPLPLFLDQTEARRAEKIFLRLPPPFSHGLVSTARSTMKNGSLGWFSLFQAFRYTCRWNTVANGSNLRTRREENREGISPYPSPPLPTSVPFAVFSCSIFFASVIPFFTFCYLSWATLWLLPWICFVLVQAYSKFPQN